MVQIGFNCQLPLSEIGFRFRRNWSYISFLHSRVLIYVFPRPFETPKNGQIPFLRIGTHTRFVTTKSIMVTPPLTTSFMNFIVIEIHVLPRQNLKLTILLPSRQRLTSVERMIHSDRHESPTTLHCQNPCCIFERGRPSCFSVYSSSRRAPLLLGPKCGTVANSSSRKKGLTKPGSLTNTNRIENTNIKELSFLYTFRGCVATAGFTQSIVVSLQHNIGHRKDLGDPPKYESQDLSENGFLFEECITAWISSH